MKTSVSVTTLNAFTWKDRSYTAGQAIDLTPIDAIVLARKRHVTLSKRKAIPAPPTPPAPVPESLPEPPKRRYKRKDIQAEDIAPTVDVFRNDPQPESSDPDPEF